MLRINLWWHAALLTIILAGGITTAAAQDLPPCFDREHFRDPPWIDGTRYCLEHVITDPAGAELAFTALAAAPDGTLYAARPLAGEVYAITDTDQDGLPDSALVVADGLTLPNGLAYHENALYIAGGPHLYRLPANGAVETLVDDLPVGSSGWAGSVIVGPDDRLYVSIGTGCDDCVPAQKDQGAILSFALDGTDAALVATGLRQGGDMAFLQGELWVTDSSPMNSPQPDELNRVRWGDDFGWPSCDSEAASATGTPCPDSLPPVLTFPAGTTPLGMTAYTSETLPYLTNTLLVTLNGSRHTPQIEGYALAVIHIDETGSPLSSEILIPVETPTRDKVGYSVAEMNFRGSGFWPQRPLDVAVSPEGWLYLSITGGQILAVRPA